MAPTDLPLLASTMDYWQRQRSWEAMDTSYQSLAADWQRLPSAAPVAAREAADYGVSPSPAGAVGEPGLVNAKGTETGDS